MGARHWWKKQTDELQISRERWTFASSKMFSHYSYNRSVFGFQSRTKNSLLGGKLPFSNAPDFIAISGGWKYNSSSPHLSHRPLVRAATLCVRGNTRRKTFFCSGRGRKRGERRVRLSVVALGCPVLVRHHHQQQRPPPKSHRHCCSLSGNISKYERTRNRCVLVINVERPVKL